MAVIYFHVNHYDVGTLNHIVHCTHMNINVISFENDMGGRSKEK